MNKNLSKKAMLNYLIVTVLSIVIWPLFFIASFGLFFLPTYGMALVFFLIILGSILTGIFSGNRKIYMKLVLLIIGLLLFNFGFLIAFLRLNELVILIAFLVQVPFIVGILRSVKNEKKIEEENVKRKTLLLNNILKLIVTFLFLFVFYYFLDLFGSISQLVGFVFSIVLFFLYSLFLVFVDSLVIKKSQFKFKLTDFSVVSTGLILFVAVFSQLIFLFTPNDPLLSADRCSFEAGDEKFKIRSGKARGLSPSTNPYFLQKKGIIFWDTILKFDLSIYKNWEFCDQIDVNGETIKLTITPIDNYEFDEPSKTEFYYLYSDNGGESFEIIEDMD